MKSKKRKSKQDEFVFFNIEELREHEEIRPDYLEALKDEILGDGILKMPICIDKKTCVILDGHHRLQALKRLGYTKIPCVLVDYQSPDIRVIAWREGEQITKERIIEIALSEKKMPSKTSKHMIILNGQWQHISAIEMIINVPLEKLK
jgi:ParB-like chromosome segregation protein Spo0J